MNDALFPRIYDWDNLVLAHRKAAKGKRDKEPAARFEYRLEDNLIALHDELRTKSYRPGPYNSFHIHEPKRRLISAAPFRDRVLHHALCNVIAPIFERSFIYDSYANRKGKGHHRALDRAQFFARRYRYVLPCDVRQFFPAIDHALLRRTLARKIGDPDLLWLVDRILESGAGVLGEEYDMVYYAGDDLLAATRPRGLPIGNLTSQFWANCLLSPFDHFVKRELRCRGYVRFVDDLLLFGDDKRQLWDWKGVVIQRLACLRLSIHEGRAQVQPVTEGIPFLGFVVYRHKRRLKRRNAVAYARRFRVLVGEYAAGRLSFERLTASARGWAIHARYGDTLGLRRDILGSAVLPARQGGRCDSDAYFSQDL